MVAGDHWNLSDSLKISLGISGNISERVCVVAVVDTVDPKGMAMTTIVKELAERGIKARVRADPKSGGSKRKKIEL